MEGVLKDFFKGKRVFITGAAGTVGRALAEKLSTFPVEELILFDNNESEAFFLREKFRDDPRVTVYLGDITDHEKIKKICRGVNIIFHCAAYKHVILSEYNSFDYVKINVLGTQNIIECALENEVDLVINTSTDKAVNPTNVMGATKLLGEKLITAANATSYGSKTIFSSVRFGNVLGSRGSIVPLLIKQIKRGGPVTLTDERMTRFVMSINDATNLVLKSATLAIGGEVFVLKMKAVRIIDLIKAVVELVAPEFGYEPESIEIKKIGAKPGEKLYEELMNEEETTRSMELKDMFVIIPAFKPIYNKKEYRYPDVVKEQIEKPYISKHEEFLSVEEIKEYLKREGVIEYCLEGGV